MSAASIEVLNPSSLASFNEFDPDMTLTKYAKSEPTIVDFLFLNYT